MLRAALLALPAVSGLAPSATARQGAARTAARTAGVEGVCEEQLSVDRAGELAGAGSAACPSRLVEAGLGAAAPSRFAPHNEEGQRVRSTFELPCHVQLGR